MPVVMSKEEILETARVVLCDVIQGRPGFSNYCAKLARSEWLAMHLRANKFPGAIDAILSLIEHERENGVLILKTPDDGFLHLLVAIEEAVGKEDADRIASILEWDEFFEGEDRSYRALILEIMEKIGSERHVPALERFAKRISSIHYKDGEDPGERFNEYDASDVRHTINICRGRTA